MIKEPRDVNELCILEIAILLYLDAEPSKYTQ